MTLLDNTLMKIWEKNYNNVSCCDQEELANILKEKTGTTSLDIIVQSNPRKHLHEVLTKHGLKIHGHHIVKDIEHPYGDKGRFHINELTDLVNDLDLKDLNILVTYHHTGGFNWGGTNVFIPERILGTSLGRIHRKSYNSVDDYIDDLNSRGNFCQTLVYKL